MIQPASKAKKTVAIPLIERKKNEQEGRNRA